LEHDAFKDAYQDGDDAGKDFDKNILMGKSHRNTTFRIVKIKEDDDPDKNASKRI
jgi:hypothetical protein